MKIAAGLQWRDLYSIAAQNNITVIGGAAGTVGVGGWTLGGGHGPLSSKYGLGADQVLELEVVTADGELRIVNEKSEPDLFWALRGVRKPFFIPSLKTLVGLNANKKLRAAGPHLESSYP